MHGLAGQQVGGGLAGALIVLPAVAPTPGSLPERVILIKNSTYAIDAVPANRVVEARLALAQHKPRLAVAPPRAPHAIDPFNPPSWPSGWPIPASAKRCNPPASAFMSHWVVNGYPVGDPKVSVKPASATLGVGARQLYRIIDATSDSYANIEMFGAQGQQENLNVVGRDGVPIDPHGNPEGLVAPFKNVLLPPAGRVDIVVTGDSQPQMLVAGNVCTGYLGELIPRRTLLVIRPSTAASASGLRRPAPLPIATTGQTSASALYRMNEHAITKRRAITFTQYADQNNPSQNQAWYVTDTSANPTGFIEQPFWLSPDPAHRASTCLRSTFRRTASRNGRW